MAVASSIIAGATALGSFAAANAGPLIAGGAGLGGALIQSGADKKAASTMASAADRAAALQNQQFETTQQNIAPFLAAGQSAIDPLSKLLGTNPAGTPAGQQAANTPDYAAYLSANPDVAAEYQRQMSNPRTAALLQRDGINSALDFARVHHERFGQPEGRPMPTLGGPAPGAPAEGAPTTGSGVPTAGTNIADLMESTYAKPAFDAGVRAVEQSAYGSGITGGGVAKELMDYGTRFGADLRQNEVGNLLALMGGGQQAATSLGSIGANTSASVANTMMNAAGARASSYADSPWASGLGFASGFFGSGGADDAIKGVGDWLRKRTDPKLKTQPYGAAKLMGAA